MIAVVPVFVMVMFEVSPVFQAETLSLTRQVPGVPDWLGDTDRLADGLGDTERLADGLGDTERLALGETERVGLGEVLPPLRPRNVMAYPTMPLSGSE